MPATLTRPANLPTQVDWDRLRPKQRKYIHKYDTAQNRAAGNITKRIEESWYTPVPAQVSSKASAVLGGTVITLLVGIVMAAVIGTPDASALYYVTTQKIHRVKSTWNLVWTWLRHAYRDDNIGLIGGLLAVFITRDLYKPLKPLTKRDKWEINFGIKIPFTHYVWHPIGNVKDDQDLTIAQILPLPVLVLVYGSLGFAGGEAIVGTIIWSYHHIGIYHRLVQHTTAHWFSFLNAHLSQHHAAMATRIHNSLVGSMPGKIVGLLTAFYYGRRPAKPVMDDLKRVIVKRRLIRNFHAGNPTKRAPRYYLRNFQLIYYTMQPDITGGSTVSKRSTFGLWTVAALGIALAIYGWYILLYVASK